MPQICHTVFADSLRRCDTTDAAYITDPDATGEYDVDQAKEEYSIFARFIFHHAIGIVNLSAFGKNRRLFAMQRSFVPDLIGKFVHRFLLDRAVSIA